MDICFFSDRYLPDDRGGAGSIAATLAARYAAAGHQVSAITTVRSEAEAGERSVEGVDVRAIRAPRHPLLRPAYSIYNPLVVPTVGQLLDDLDPDLVHAHNVHEFLSYRALTAADRRRIPIVLTYHDAMSVRYGGKLHHFVRRGAPETVGRPDPSAYRIGSLRALREFAYPWHRLREQPIPYVPLYAAIGRRHIAQHVDVSVAVSRELRRALVANDVTCDAVVHNGVDPGPYQAADPRAFRERFGLGDDPTVLFSGRAGYYKGGEHLARGFKDVVEQVPSARLVVTGSGGAPIERMRREAAPVTDRITTTGWIEETEMRSAYRAATLVVSPSIYLDPFPTVNLQAMAAGTPVVTTCFGGAKELVDHRETGLVVNPLDTAALGEAITRLLTDRALGDRYGESGRERVAEQFHLDGQLDLYKEIYESIL